MKLFYTIALALTVATPKAFCLTNAVSVATGGNHSLALLSDGTVKSWGDGHQWDAGDGSATSYPTPISILDTNTGATNIYLSNAVAIAAGGQFSMVLLANSNLVMWGRGNENEQGNGAGFAVHYPTLNTNISNVTAIAAGSTHAMAISNGYVYCWGDNTYGEGAFGTMFLNNSSIWQATPGGTNRPSLVSGLSNAVAVAASEYYSVALLSDGSVWAWGQNGQGQLGNGQTLNTNVPQQVIGASNIMAISAGYAHTLALSSNGYVYAWGNGTEGELGNGSISDQTNAVLVSDFTYYVTNITYPTSVTNWDAPVTNVLYYGPFQTTNVVTNSALEITTCVSNYFLSSNVITRDFCIVQDPVTNVVTNTFQGNVIAISAGDEQSFALTSDNHLWVWGRNGDSVLGIGTTVVVSTNKPTAVLTTVGTSTVPLSNVAAIASQGGSLHALAILKDTAKPSSPGATTLMVNWATTRRQRTPRCLCWSAHNRTTFIASQRGGPPGRLACCFWESQQHQILPTLDLYSIALTERKRRMNFRSSAVRKSSLELANRQA